MDFDYTDVKPDLSGLTVKGRHERAQMVFGSETVVPSDAKISDKKLFLCYRHNMKRSLL